MRKVLYNFDRIEAVEMTLVAPAVDVRDRIPDEIIRELVAWIAYQFKPVQIILFGSYTYGNPRPQSDVDLLLIMNTQ